MKSRRLVIDDRTYFVRVTHLHDRGRNDCRDVLTVRSDLPRSAALRLVFRGGPGRVVGGGYNPTGMLLLWCEHPMNVVPPGTALRIAPTAALNLHQPGVARAFIDVLCARGWDGVTGGDRDGWELFDAALARHSAGGPPVL